MTTSVSSPLVVPVIRDEVGHGYCHLFFAFSFLFSPFSHCVLYQQSPTPIFHCYSTFFSYSFQISLKAVLPSHSQTSSPPFSLHFLGICSFCKFFISHFPTCPFQPTPHQFILNTFLHSNLHSQFFHFFLSALFTTVYHESSYPVVFKNLHHLMLFFR